ncbi:hypothetical protein CFP56_012758 [Quercus suber]|uniref:Uncharacterized protein n=1 Tax=Quercus suber TaxID=58331 RepID=A0AAW0KXH7_QUESU
MHGMICSPCSMENLALNMKRVSLNSNLLEVKRFSWDEIQQKISAADYVWDNYIKVHYHIYLVIVEEKEGRTSSDSECLGTNWTSTMDRYLIELLQDQVLKGIKLVMDLCPSHGLRWLDCSMQNLNLTMTKMIFVVFLMLLMYKICRCILMLRHIEINLFPAITNYVLYMVKKFVMEDTAFRRDDIHYYANNGCFTTDWTPSMDRHLIDVMLEEVHNSIRGRRLIRLSTIKHG